jgi:hypothetical protein
MAPSSAGLLAGIPLQHLGGLAVAAVFLVAGWLLRVRDPVGLLLLATAGVHLGLAPGHASEPVLAALFVANAGAYLAVLGLRNVGWRRWRLAAGALLTATILAYLVVLAARREAPDPVGTLDKLIELTALGLVMLPRAGSRRRLRRVAASGATVVLTAVTGSALWLGGAVGAGHAHGVADCTPNHHGGFGAVLRPAPCAVTPEQQAAAQRLVEETRAGIAPYQDVRLALAAGYRPTAPFGPAVHYTNQRVADHGSPLDPRHPAALVYANTRHGAVLLGAMYQMPKVGQPGPDIGGAITPWHYHTNVCISLPGLFISGLSTPFGACPPGSVRITSADQLHVWTAPNPNGPFGDLDDAWARRLASS